MTAIILALSLALTGSVGPQSQAVVATTAYGTPSRTGGFTEDRSTERGTVRSWSHRTPVSYQPMASRLGTVMLGGSATWYDGHPGEAAAGPALRIGDWRGSTVRVCAQTCIVVRLTDWCACGERAGKDTLLDLDRRDFAKLAPLSRGVVSVTVELLGDVALPATDVAPSWWDWHEVVR